MHLCLRVPAQNFTVLFLLHTGQMKSRVKDFLCGNSSKSLGPEMSRGSSTTPEKKLEGYYELVKVLSGPPSFVWRFGFMGIDIRMMRGLVHERVTGVHWL